MRLVSAVVIVLIGASCASSTVPADPVANEWSRVYLTDLEAARDTIAANHPGAEDRENPAFRATLRSAYDEAQRAAPQVVDYDSYRVALTRFANAFQDAHLSISFKQPFESLRDAGIVTTLRGREFVVTDADARYANADQLRGATLVSCDGQPARDHFEKRVLSWRGRPAIEADWHQLAPVLFVDYGPPAPRPPSRCRFLTGGHTIELPLSWTATTPDHVAEMEAPSAAGRVLGIERIGDMLWVNVPTFSVNDETSIAAMRSLIDSFRENVARLDWRLLVFDLRGNSGGSAAWGQQLASALFGEEWTRAAREWLSDGVYTEWRVSSDNVDAIAGHIRQAEQRHGADSEAAKQTRAFHQILSEALARGDVFWSQPRERSGIPPPPEPTTLPGRVVLITSATCFSACLDFVDIMRLHAGVVHVGETTGVDTVYMENWGKPLPSGHGRIGYPMKVYRNRRRGNNEPYVPHVRYEGMLEDTAALQRWVVENHGPSAEDAH